jgi:hypothetical protein
VYDQGVTVQRTGSEGRGTFEMLLVQLASCPIPAPEREHALSSLSRVPLSRKREPDFTVPEF